MEHRGRVRMQERTYNALILLKMVMMTVTPTHHWECHYNVFQRDRLGLDA